MPLVKRLSIIALAALLLLLSAPIIALLTLGHSEAALRYVVAQLPTKAGSLEQLKVENVRGTLAGGFTVDRIVIEHDVVFLSIEGIRGRLELLPLLWQTIDVSDFEVTHLEIESRPRDKPLPTEAKPFLPRLLTLEARQTRIHNTTIKPPRGDPVVFKEVTAHGTIRERRIWIRDAKGSLGNIELKADGILKAAIPLGLEAQATATFASRRGPRWVATVSTDGDLERLPLKGGLIEPFVAELDEASLRALPPWNLRGIAKVSKLDFTRFGGSAFFGDIGGQLTLAFDSAGYRATGSLDSPGLDAGPVDVEFDGTFARNILRARLLKLAHAPSRLRVDTSGTVIFEESGPALALSGRWQNFRWPLLGNDIALQSDRGLFTLEGLGNYDIRTEASLQIGVLPPMDATVSGSLQPGKFVFDQSRFDLLEGTSLLSGELGWRPELSWKVAGRVKDIDPSGWRAGLGGKVGFSLVASGNGSGSKSRIDLTLSELNGRLRGAAASGGGKLRIANSGYRFDAVDVAFGGFDLELDGLLSDTRRDLDFRIKANDLALIAPGATGSLYAKGVLRGTSSAMRVLLDATGDNLRLPTMQIGRLRAAIDVDPLASASTPAAINVAVSDLRSMGRQIESLDFKLNGTTSEHQLTLDIRDRDATVSARGTGVFDAQTWQQRWDRLDLDLPADIGLAVVEPLSVNLTISSADVEPFCLRARKINELTGSAELCMSAAWSEGAWNARFDIARLPIASVLPKPWLKASYDGTISAAASIGAAATGPLLGTLRADFRDARLNWLRASGKRDTIPLGSGYLDVSSSSETIIGLLDIAAGERGRASGQLLALRGAGSWAEMPLQAKLIADSTALGLLNLYVPEIDRSAGDLSIDFDFGGTVGAPLVNGVLRLERGELDFYQLNLALRDIAAEARLIDNRITLQSSASAGKGRIRADADLEWRRSLPFGSLRIQGTDIPIIDLPEARITATPDLEFKVDGRDLLATGTVVVPSARLTPVDLTGAVSTSTDEVLVGAEPADPASSFRVSSDIKLTLGERVTVDSFGLSGRVAGNINLRSTPDGVNRGSGELGVVEGKYAALGRRLDIERGRLIFSGGLINDPGVDIRATKEFPDVKAGVNVRGTLREPRMSFFSEPSLPQSQVVSLILAGGTIEATQTSDSTSSASRTALLAQGGAILAQQLGQRIGIEDVGIEQNLANETSLVFGKYLSSRLYVSYGISLAETLNTLKLRYSINDRWTVRTEAGKEVSADVVYTVERP